MICTRPSGNPLRHYPRTDRTINLISRTAAWLAVALLLAIVASGLATRSAHAQDVFTVGNYVWLDMFHPTDVSATANGIQDEGELGLNGLVVVLMRETRPGSANWQLYQTTITANDTDGNPGYYQFAIPAADQANFRIAFQFPLGARLSPADIGSDATDSDGISTAVGFSEYPDARFVSTAPFDVNDSTMPTREDMNFDQGFWYSADFGDAPATYPVTGPNAAYHIQVNGITMHLGRIVDDELDGQPNATATGDDIAPGVVITNRGALNDDDGVQFPGLVLRDGVQNGILTKGITNTLIVSTTLANLEPGMNAYAHIWIDLNGDGDWDDADEKVLDGLPVDNGVNNVALPATALTSATVRDTFMRIRLSDQATLAPAGGLPLGEVEDYYVQIIEQPTLRIAASSEVHTPASAEPYGDLTKLAIGEVVRYTLTVPLPRGELFDFRMDQVIPTGMFARGNPLISYVAEDEITVLALAISPLLPGDHGEDLAVNLGYVNNPNTGVGFEYLNLGINLQVSNIAENHADTPPSTRGSNFTASYNNYTVQSNTVHIDIVEPQLTVDKSAETPLSLDAGATVTYTIVFRSETEPVAERFTAFDVLMTDLLPPHFVFPAADVQASVGVTDVTATFDGTPPRLELRAGAMEPGSVITVTYTTQISDTALASETITNTANVEWTSLPGPRGTETNPTGSITNGTAGDETGKRTGDGNSNVYLAAGRASITLDSPQIAILPMENPWTIGSYITFTLAITLPEGVTQDIVITDTLPAGLRYESSGGIPGNFAGTLPSPIINPNAGGNSVTWTLGDITNPADNDTTNDTFYILVRTVVLNVMDNQSGVTLVNNASMAYRTTSAQTVTSPPVDVELVEPVLQFEKSVDYVSPIDAGDPVTYTIVIQHDPLSTAIANDVVLSDTLPAGLFNYSVASTTFSNGSSAPPASVVDGAALIWPAGGGQSIGGMPLPITETITIVLNANLAMSITFGTLIMNDAQLTWASLQEDRFTPGVDFPERRTHGDGLLNDYMVTDSVMFTSDGEFNVEKQLVATSAEHTTGSEVTIGEFVTYTSRVRLPEGVANDVTIFELIPPGMSLITTTIVTLADPALGLEEDYGGVPTGTIDGGLFPNIFVWLFEQLTTIGDNNPDNNEFMIVTVFSVDDVPENVGLPSNQTALPTGVLLQTDEMDFEVTDVYTTTVVEPRLEIHKQIVPSTATQNQAVTVTITVSNTGLSSAFDTTLMDSLPLGLTYDGGLQELSSADLAPANLVTSTTLISGTWAEFPAGEVSVITFRARVADQAFLPDTPLRNTATLTGMSSLPGSPPIERHQSTVDSSAYLTIHTHDLELEKVVMHELYQVGGPLTYALNYFNSGTTIAQGVVITETVPPHTTFAATNAVSAWYRADNPAVPCATGDPAGTQCVYSAGNIPAGSTGSVFFAVNLDHPLPAPAAPIVNTATIHNNGVTGREPTPLNNTATVTVTFASLGDYVWHDLNANGIQDAAEDPLADVVVTLQSPDGTALLTTTTTITGHYLFTGLGQGDYIVHFAAPSGMTPTLLGAGGNVAVDSNVDPATGQTGVNTITLGASNLTIDAGFYRLARLGGVVWHDQNANSTRDGGEPGLSDVTVNLLNAQGNLLRTTTTNANGDYVFTDLLPGDYYIEFATPPGYLHSPLGVGASDTSGIGPQTPPVRSERITLAPGAEESAVSAGFFMPASLGNYVWQDNNEDGVRDPGEPPLAGVTILLFRAGEDDPIADTVTDADGVFLFTNLTPGNYQLQFISPSGYSITLPGVGGPLEDSDIDPETGRTAVIVLEEGMEDLTWGGGFYQLTPSADPDAEEPDMQNFPLWLPAIQSN